MYRAIIPASLLLVSVLGFAPAPAHAQLQVFKFVEGGVIATDNLQLFDGAELVYRVKPSVELSFKGNRFDSDVVAGVELYQFNERGDLVVDPRLDLRTTGTLINNLVFVNSSFNVGKLFPGEDFFDLNEDSDSQLRFRFNPFIARSFGRVADLFFGYGLEARDTDLDGDIDTQQDTLSFSLSRDPKNGGFIWGIGANYEQDRTGSNTFDGGSVYASSGATVGQTVYFEFLTGAELNDFTENVDTDDSDVRTFWEASLNWTPSERTSFRFGWADRFFGGGPTFTFNKRVRNSTITANWTRDISNSDIFEDLGNVTTFTEPAPGNPVAPGSNIDLDGSTVNGVLFVEERVRFGYKLAGRRSDLVADAIYSFGEELDGDARNERLVGRVAFDRHLSPATTVRVQYEHLISDDNDTDRENENRLGIRLFYNFDRKPRRPQIDDDL